MLGVLRGLGWERSDHWGCWFGGWEASWGLAQFREMEEIIK